MIYKNTAPAGKDFKYTDELVSSVMPPTKTLEWHQFRNHMDVKRNNCFHALDHEGCRKENLTRNLFIWENGKLMYPRTSLAEQRSIRWICPIHPSINHPSRHYPLIIHPAIHQSIIHPCSFGCDRGNRQTTQKSSFRSCKETLIVALFLIQPHCCWENT